MLHQIAVSNLATKDLMTNIYNSNEFSSLAPRPFINRRKGEQKILALISMGDVTLLKEQFNSPQISERIDLGQLSENPLTHAKYMGVIMAALA